jgi:hypothetical protein
LKATFNKSRIIEILHSITRIEVDSGNDVTFYFNGKDEPFSYLEFEKDSFTRDLLELITEKLQGNNE